MSNGQGDVGVPNVHNYDEDAVPRLRRRNSTQMTMTRIVWADGILDEDYSDDDEDEGRESTWGSEHSLNESMSHTDEMLK